MKKIIKISAILLSVNILFLIMPSAFAYDGLILSEPTYSVSEGGSETTVPAPEPGFVITAIEVKNPGDSERNACLVVAATDNTTGKLAAINVDTRTVPKNGSITLSKGIELKTNQTLHYYVWESVINHKPLLNTPPTGIKNLLCEPKTNSVDLSWDPSLDDRGVKYYSVRVDGEEVAKAKENSYSVLGLDKLSSYDFEVFACDEEGLKSDSASSVAETYGIEELILSDYKNESGTLEFLKNHEHNTMDSYTIPEEEYAGRYCFKNEKLPKGYNGFFYIRTDPTYIDSKTNSVAVEVTYFDDDLGAVSMGYKSEAGESKTASFGSRTNTKTWKTSHVVVNDANLVNTGFSENTSFRFESYAGTRIYKVAVAPGDFYAPDSPNVRFGDGVTDTYDLAFFPEDAASAYGMNYDNIDGTPCMYAPNGGKFEFNITDEYAVRTGGYIEVNYYDSGEDVLVLNYPNIKNEKPTVDFENTGSFKTVRIPLEAATFDNSITGASGKKFDFTLSAKNGSPLAISSVKYVAGDSDYVAVPKTEIFSEMNENGTDFEGELGLNSTFNYTPGTGGYDYCALYSGTAGREPLDGKHYIFNKDYGDTSWRKWKNAFYINVPKTFLDGTDYGSVEITVELYTEKGAILMEYNDGSGTNKTIKNSGIETGKWTTTTFTMDKSTNMQFNRGIPGSTSTSSFRFNSDGEELKIHKVTIKKND